LVFHSEAERAELRRSFQSEGTVFHVEELRALKLLDHYKLHESGRSKLVVEFVEKADAAQGQEAAEMMKATPSSQLEASKGNYFRDSWISSALEVSP